MYITQDIANRIKLQAQLRKITMKNLLSNCELNINAISEFSKGKQLSCISLAKIADYLNCSVDYLLGRTNNPEINADLAEVFDLYFSEYKASAGTGSFLGERIDSGLRIRVDYDIYGNADEAIRIVGDSMEPYYHDGQIIAVKHKPVINNGEIGVFILNGEGYIKRLRKDGAKVYLVSLNEKYEPIQIKSTDNLLVIGKVLTTIPESDIIEYIDLNNG